MEEASRATVVVVHAGTSPRGSSEILRWLRVLMPTALFVMSPGVAPLDEAYDVINIDADASDLGPLALADAIVRDRENRRRAGPSAEDPRSKTHK